MGAFIICMTLVHNISTCISGHILAFRFTRKCSFLTLKVNCKLKKKNKNLHPQTSRLRESIVLAADNRLCGHF